MVSVFKGSVGIFGLCFSVVNGDMGFSRSRLLVLINIHGKLFA